MNKTILTGRLTKDVDARYTTGANQLLVSRYTLAVDRRFKRDGEASADFINCISFGKSAEFAEKYFRKGMKVSVVGRIQTGSYTNRDGVKVYTTDVVVEEQEFCESKQIGNSEEQQPSPHGQVDKDGFLDIPDNIDEELPFC